MEKETVRAASEWKSVFGALLGSLLCIAALVVLQQAMVQDWLKQNAAAAQTPVFATLVALLIATVVGLCKSIWKLLPIAEVGADDDEQDSQEKEGLSAQAPPAGANAGEYWHRQYVTCRSAFQQLVRRGNVKLVKQSERSKELHRAAMDATERTGALHYALLCGVVMAVSSAIVTFWQPPTPQTWLVEHVRNLIVAYIVVAFAFGLRAGSTVRPPNRNIGARVGGLAAFYANGVSVIINLPYSWLALFSQLETTPRIGSIPLGYLIVTARLVLLPLVSLLSCWLGSAIGQVYRSSRLHPAPLPR